MQYSSTEMDFMQIESFIKVRASLPQYVLLGPWVESKARQEVEQEDFELHHPLGSHKTH